MFGKASNTSNELLLVVAMLVLAVGWFLLVSGAFHLTLAVFQAPTNNEMGQLAIWELAFSFGAVSIATLLAARAEFLGKPKVRGLFLYSQIAASILFLGYLSYGVVSALIHAGGSS